MAAEEGRRVGIAGRRLLRSLPSALRRMAGQSTRRMGWGVADQAISSLTNFAASIFVVHILGAVQFGAYSLAYVTYTFALNASRGIATDPLMVRFSGTDVQTWRHAVARCTAASLGIGFVTGMGVLAVSLMLSGPTRAAFVALGLTLPGLLLQDSWRYSFFALGRGSRAFLNDLIWACGLIPALLVLRATGHASVFWFVLAWGLTACVGAVVGPLQAGVVPLINVAHEWFAKHRDLGLRYFGEGASSTAASQIRTYGISLILGLAALGYVQAANTLMGPVNVIFLGMSLVTIPEAARILHRAPQRLTLFCALVSAGLAATALSWGAVLLITVPKGLGALLLGSVWRQAYPLLLPSVIANVGICICAGASAGLHALGAARRSLKWSVLLAIPYLGCSLVGAAEGGSSGTMWGSAASAWIGVLVLWWQFRAGLMDYGDVPRRAPRRSHSTARHRAAPAFWPVPLRAPYRSRPRNQRSG